MYKKFILILTLLLMTFVKSQTIDVQKYQSPDQLLAKSTVVGDTLPLELRVFESKIAKTTKTQVTIYDKYGQVKQVITTDGEGDKRERVLVSYPLKKIIVNRPRLSEKPWTDGSDWHFIKAFNQEVYDFTGELLFTFESESFQLFPLNQNYYISLGLTGDESEGSALHNPIKETRIYDSNGQYVKTLDVFFEPNFLMAANDSMSVIESHWYDNNYWALNQDGNILWKIDKDVRHQYNYSISDNNLTCFPISDNGTEKVILIDFNGKIVKEIIVSDRGGSVRETSISHNGNFVVWYYEKGKEQREISVYDLTTDRIVWEKNIQNMISPLRGRNCLQIEFLDNDNIFYALYLKELLFFDITGKHLHTEQFASRSLYSWGQQIIMISDNNLTKIFLKNHKNFEVTEITITSNK